MYKLSIPVMLNDRFDREATLKELLRAGADRVFLAVDMLSFDEEKHQKMLTRLKENIPFFRQNGLEVGVWFWTLWRSNVERLKPSSLLCKKNGEPRVRYSGVSGSSENGQTGFCCPTSEEFVQSALKQIKDVAACGPDLLMLDDDFRYGFHDDALGCYCDGHMRLISQRLGRPITRDELHAAVWAPKPSAVRNTWYDVMGETLKDFAKKMRAAVDEVNPSLPIVPCSVISLWDSDGVDSVTISRLLAGKNKPMLRFSGAPYWSVRKNWGNRLQHTIETERMEMSWCKGEDMEIMTEGDVYPRPRQFVPASYLEGFDTALRAADVGSGILKYMLDYTSSPRYETGYIDRHLHNEEIYAAIPRLFENKTAVGVRVYESMKKLCDAELTDVENPEKYARDMFFSVAARMLADNTIPTVYEGTSPVGIAFGENARHLPREAFEGALILDVRAARILTEQGIDVGVAEFGEQIAPSKLYYPRENEYTTSNGRSYRLFPKEGAEVVILAEFCGEQIPDTLLYQNADGQRFMVFGFDSACVDEARYRSYAMQRLLTDAIEELGGKPLPAKCQGNPDLYMLCKTSEEGMAIGLWNFFADEIIAPRLVLDRAYDSVEFVNCTGKMNENEILLSPIKAYEFAFVCVK